MAPTVTPLNFHAQIDIFYAQISKNNLSSLSKPKGKKRIVENKLIVFTVQKIFFD